MERDEPRKQADRERERFEERIIGMMSDDKPFARPVTMVPPGMQPLLFQQPLYPLHRPPQGMPHIPAPYLTQASLFYTPQFIPSQQLSISQQQMMQQRVGVIHQVPPLLQMNSGIGRDLQDDRRQEERREERRVSYDSQYSPESDHERMNTESQPTRVIRSSNDEEIDVVDSPSSHSSSSLPGTPMSAASPQTGNNPKSPETPPMFPMPSPVSLISEVCAICHDKATGHHYGVTSCEGCKGFFKRSVQNKKVYTCRNLTKDCPIDKRHRNRCQHCRYQKCIQAGMLKDAVREDRTPGGKHKTSMSRMKFKQEPTPNKQRRLSSSSSTTSSVISVAPPQPKLCAQYSELLKELTQIGSMDNPSNGECPGCKETELKEKTLAHVTQLAEQQIIRSRLWFDHLPLLKEIDKEDQKTLITNVWVELMLSNLIKTSVKLENMAKLCEGQILDFETAEATGISDIMQRVVQMASKFREFRLEVVEFICMKVIILLNPDLPGLKNQALVEQLQDKVHSALQEYINTHFPQEPNRFGNILLRLPELRSIGTKCLERLFMLNLTGQIHPSVSLSDLLHSGKR